MTSRRGAMEAASNYSESRLRASVHGSRIDSDCRAGIAIWTQVEPGRYTTRGLVSQDLLHGSERHW